MEATDQMLTRRLDDLERMIPEALASMRSDMLRAVGTAVQRSDEGTKAALAPLKEQLDPLTAMYKRTHQIIRWAVVSIAGIAVALATAYAMQLFGM